MNLLLTPLLLIIILSISFSINSYSLTIDSNLGNLSPSQIDHLCSYISNIETRKMQSPQKRFALPFPDMNRFLSTSRKLHHHNHHANTKSGTEFETKKYDFQGYLCSILKDPEEMSNFISMFIEEHGEAPAFHLFESCEQIAKRDDKSTIRFNELSQVCSSRHDKRWKNSIKGPINIDFINQMLEARKVKSYPYSAQIDPYLVMVKPDDAQCSVVGDVVYQFERRAYKLMI
ncbi:unnamed protein product [Rotaria sordida]|uniref:Uncharacterized protein n=1 Tax=Rotaria sordida TaxID=392033 RepID=A0A819J4T0_9BILA|nr:unnamed protein product [Rotaria sordida]